MLLGFFFFQVSVSLRPVSFQFAPIKGSVPPGAPPPASRPRRSFLLYFHRKPVLVEFPVLVSLSWTVTPCGFLRSPGPLPFSFPLSAVDRDVAEVPLAPSFFAIVNLFWCAFSSPSPCLPHRDFRNISSFSEPYRRSCREEEDAPLPSPVFSHRVRRG